MIWSQYDEPEVNVYLSSDGSSVTPLTSSGINVTPNLFKSQSLIWATWVDKTNPDANQLKYARLSGDGIVEEIGSVATAYGHAFSPSIALDPEQRRVWLLWAENNGRREVLYASFRDLGGQDRGTWQTALQITPDDDYSSNLPMIDSAAYDRIEISWLRTSQSSSESASTEIQSSDWLLAKAMQRGSNSDNSAGVQSLNRPVVARNLQGYGKHIKRLDKFYPHTAEEQAWSTMVKNKRVLTGATHSGAGPSARLVKEVQ